MPDPLADPLYIDRTLFRHDWWQGKRGAYVWLQSRQLTCDYFFRPTHPPANGYRMIATKGLAMSEALFYRPQSEWDQFGNCYLSRVLHKWPKYLDPRSLDGSMVLPAWFEPSQLPSDFNDIPMILCPFGTPETEAEQGLWQLIERFEATHYLCDHKLFTLATTDEDVFNEFIHTDEFINVDQKLYEMAVQCRRELWEAIGPETGPDRCIEPGCTRLRISLAIRCFPHQLEWRQRQMSYDIDLFIPIPGKSLEESHQQQCRTEQSQSFTAAELQKFRDLAGNVMKEIPFEYTESEKSLQLMGTTHEVQLSFFAGGGAAISVPYGGGELTTRVNFDTLLKLIQLLERLEGYKAFDPQTEEMVSKFDRSYSQKMLAVAGYTNEVVTDVFGAKRAKPWWSFW